MPKDILFYLFINNFKCHLPNMNYRNKEEDKNIQEDMDKLILKIFSKEEQRELTGITENFSNLKKEQSHRLDNFFLKRLYIEMRKLGYNHKILTK